MGAVSSGANMRLDRSTKQFDGLYDYQNGLYDYQKTRKRSQNHLYIILKSWLDV